MDNSLRSFTAFRVFGVFHWPPVPNFVNDQRLEEGVVEIHYVDTGQQGPRAVLRWLPRTILATNVSTRFALTADDLSVIPYLHRLSADDLATKFEAYNEVRIRLDGDGSSVLAGSGERLLFRGARVFDQFALDQNSNFDDDSDKAQVDPAPDLRWVLARRYDQASASFFSEIVIGAATDTPKASGSTIRFNLALPTPIAQCVIGKTRVRALPFSVTYAPIGKSSDFGTTNALPVKTFMAGSSDPAAVSDEEIDPTGKVADTRLGSFGFCRRGGRSEFLYFPRSRSSLGHYWLNNLAVYRDELLGRFGDVAKLQTRSFVFGRLASSTANGHFWDSVAFSRPSAPRHTRMVFRSGICGRHASSTGDLVINDDGHLAIRDPSQPSQYIETKSPELIVELDLDYTLASSDIWKVGSAEVGEPTITVRLGFSSIRIGELFGDAINGMRLARIDLQHIGAAQPQSILPHIEVVDNRDVRFMLTCEVAASFVEEGRLDWGRRRDDGAWSGATFRLSMWPEERFIGYHRTDKQETYYPLKAIIAPYSFAYAADATRANQFPVELGYDEASPGGGSPHFCQFRVLPTRLPQAGSKLTGRLGGLEFSTRGGQYLVKDDAAERDYSHWRFGPRKAIGDPAQKNVVTANVDLRLRFAIAAVVPLGVDVPWGDRTERSRPLLVPRGPSGNGDFILDLRETLSEDADRFLTASILDRDQAPGEASDETANGISPVGNGEYVLVGEEPFTIAKFRSTALSDRGTQENASVATYDSDTRSWQLKIVAPHYHYEFPPQVVGESMDKPRRLEIVDWTPSDPSANGVVPPRPQPSEDPSGLQQRAVEFRLAPSAEIWIEPSDVARGYFLPEWASYEIFRQSGAYGLGAALAALRGEFLYGLSVGVDVTRETGIARGARVAEIAALTGRPPGAPRSSNADAGLMRRWDAVSRVIARRPERLEIWSRDLDSSTPFAPARFSAGVAFALRSTAVHRPAVTHAKLPPNTPESRLPRSRDHGLSGGALWPIESANLFDKLLAAPASDGGSIERIALSPHGGDADQKATFLQGQVAIISETRGGFVQRHKVEVIGRIGVFWHRAKHVVVYERTVNPTAQFTPEGWLGSRTRRPVLRKVSEYVELLPPIRSYPDFASAKPATCGFLTAVHFNSTVINVDSAWSEDLGDYGWKIPLWNRDSARKRPQVYPRPDIAFVTHAEGEGDRPSGAQECLEPDNLFFVADFEKGGADTDSWQSRVGIDYSAFPAPTYGWQAPFGDAENANGIGRQASALRVPRGHRRFTWRLAPAARRTTLNAGRADEPIYAGLESITFMRSTPTDGGSFTAKLDAARKDVDETLAPPKHRLPIWGPGGQAPTPLDGVGTALRAFREATAAQPPDPTTVIATASELKAQLEKVPDKLKTGDLKLFADDAQSGARHLGTLKTLVGSVPQRCEKLAKDILGSLKRKELVILENLSAWENEALSHVPEEGQLLELDELKKWLVIEAVKAIRPALHGVSTDRLGLSNGIEAARAIIRDFESDVVAVRGMLNAKLAEFRRSYRDGKPWSDARIRSLLEKLQAERDGVLSDVRSAVSDAQLRLATELDDLCRRVGALASEAISIIGSQSSALTQQLADARAAVTGALATAIAAINALLAPDSNGKDRFALVDDEVAKIENGAGPYKPRVAQLRKLVTALRQRAVATRDDLDAFSNTIGKDIAALSRAISTIAAKSTGFATELSTAVDEARAIAGAAAGDGFTEVESRLRDLVKTINETIGGAVARITSVGAVIDGVVEGAERQVHDALETEVFARITSILELASDAGEALSAKVKNLEKSLSGDNLIDTVLKPLIQRVVKALFAGVDPDSLTPYEKREHDRLIAIVSRFTDKAREELRSLSDAATGSIGKELVDACNTLGGGLSGVLERLENLGDALIADARKQIKELDALIKNNDVQKLVEDAKAFDRDIRMIGNDLAASYAATIGYAEKVFDSVGNLGTGGLAAAPSNILKLYAAAASAPQLANLGFSRQRLAYYYGRLNEIIDTTPVEAWFGRLGDELKALGLSLPLDKLSDRLLPHDLSSLDIGRVFKNFGGIKLDQLFQGYKLPRGANEAIKVTHAFDKKLFRAWVQIDVDVPIPGRRSLFSVGPFQLDFVDSRMVGQVRLEANKDTDKVEQTGCASVGTDIEAVVGGQTMVSLRKVAVRFERGSGLKVDFDPKNIKLNAIFQFVQDTLGSLFPDQVGGLNLIKRDGIPVGVEHEFSMPPVSLMYGTSGVTNIQISNRFALVAYPDFLISDRFSLSKPELPFVFSIFIIGGTGYITIDTEYRPFGKQLMVVVEAAAGGSASLGFGFGPVSGSVMISLSVALAYRKLIGTSGGGLTVSLVLLVAGNVSVAGIVTVYIGLLLRMSYRDSGQIDASGTLKLTIRIAFFKITVRANVQYKLRGGRSQTTSSVSTNAEVTDKQLETAKAKEKAEKLLAARS